MCNPRRVTVTATRNIAEAWQREVSRTVELSEQVVGEARLRQALSSSLGNAALRALEARLAAGAPGWQTVDEGYRYDVEGGYVLYRPDEQALEIVASLHDVVQAQGSAVTVLQGELRDTLTAEEARTYYEDGYAGRNEARAREEAEEAVQKQLSLTLKERLAQAERQAESAEDARLQAKARQDAEQKLARSAEERRQALNQQAKTHLETVGLRCRQAFHQLLAQAYRDAILAYARRQGAEGIECHEDEGVLEIEFFVDG